MYVEKERGNYMDQTYMKEQPVLKLILSMALPMVLSMMVSSLYNIVDSFFIARISEDAMTALSLVYPVPESGQCCDDRIWNRNQCGHLILPGSAG